VGGGTKKRTRQPRRARARVRAGSRALRRHSPAAAAGARGDGARHARKGVGSGVGQRGRHERVDAVAVHGKAADEVLERAPGAGRGKGARQHAAAKGGHARVQRGAPLGGLRVAVHRRPRLGKQVVGKRGRARVRRRQRRQAH
jgi:hypothetical protein